MIWLIGNKGMLGRHIALELEKRQISFVGSDVEVDITNPDALKTFADERADLDWIINCSAYTAVDKAESEPEKAAAINADGVGNIAAIAKLLDAKLIHFSTDYVFDGDKLAPYDENDAPNPVSIYGRTKLAGEERLINCWNRHFIIRVSWLYGPFGGNFVATMSRLMREKETLNVVDDQMGSPTYTGKLAVNIATLIESGSEAYGVYHYSDAGDISWHQFAERIRDDEAERGANLAIKEIHPIPSEQYPTPAARPKNSRLNKTKIQNELKFDVVDWRVNLNDYFEALTQLSK